ncbi:hypothetical protein [Pseudomonas oryzae]|uniref:hypothetical protein n=1 Tax=Pseudomonas oryzae TaxID=1392877 RepID=UPI0012FE2343|nr:hypothetical protein [Pseudomonas oryzae]
MKYISYRLIMALLAFSSAATAENYEISVTRKGSNLYKIDIKDIFIHTKYCYEYVYGESSILKMKGMVGEIIFTEAGATCQVKAVYGKSEQVPGNFVVTVSREDDDWYEIFGQGLYVKTNTCISLALGTEAVLTIMAGGYGTLHIDGNQCMVEGVYSRLRL